MSQMVPVIVIVEDDQNLAKMYEERFKQEKFVVILSGDGEDAVAKINQEVPDIILLDLMLPKRGGLGVMQILKSVPKTKDIPIVVLSAYPQEEYIAMAKHYGAVDFLSKSDVMPAQVVAQIKEIIGWKK